MSLNEFFRLEKRKTTLKTEILAGLTTFLTMSYVIFLVPNTLVNTGMDAGAVFVATCLVSAFSCLMMGFMANMPLALAPGITLLFFFTYTVCGQMGYSWQVALGCVFISGLLFVAISLSQMREWIINTIPMTLKKSIAAGIGGFLFFISLQNSKIIVDNPGTLVQLGDIFSPLPLFTFLCLFLIIALEHAKVVGGVLIAILATSGLSVLLGFSEFSGIFSMPPSIMPTLFKADIWGAFDLSLIAVIFAFFFVDLFDTAGTMISIADRTGLIRPNGSIPRLRNTLLSDSSATVLGSLFGVSNTTAYVESASGVAAGGRTGLTAIVCGFCFLVMLFFSPLATMITPAATAGAIIYVSVNMMYAIGDIDWKDISEATPALLTIFGMTLTYSIADGITLGFVSYALVKSLTGKAKEISIGVWFISLMLIGRVALMLMLTKIS